MSIKLKMPMAEDQQKLYFIAVVPNEDIVSQVTDFKKYIAENYQSRHSLKSPPHVTLHMPFKWKENKEKLLIDFLDKFSLQQNSFDVELRNFSAFPRRVIYIHVVENRTMAELYQQLSSEIRKSLKIFNDSYKNQGFTPHMTIAHRDLKPAAFDKAWAEFSGRGFEKDFCVDHICLMKHNGKNWEIFKRIWFGKNNSS
jgi:2'-5' RNA ligase